MGVVVARRSGGWQKPGKRADCKIITLPEPLLFALLVHPRIPLRNSTAGNLGKGLIYGTALAILSAVWWVPYVAFPHSGAGVFSTGFGWKLVFGIFLWHWIYGWFLGTVYNPLPVDESARA